MNNKILVGIVIAIILVGAGGFYIFSNGEGETQELTHVSVKFRWVPHMGYSGLYVADTKGFYEDAGLNVTFVPVDLNQLLIPAVDYLESGTADFAEGSGLEALQAFGQGKDIKVIIAMYQISPYVFTSLKESNITSPSDFEGKKLGINRGNAEGFVLYPAVLRAVGLDPADAEIFPVGVDIASILTSGEADVVDGFRIAQPYEVEQAGLDYNLIYPEQYGVKGYDQVLMTSQELIDENPELVRTFVEATIKGWEYTFDNPDESIDIILSYPSIGVFAERDYNEFIFEEVKLLVEPTGGQTIGHMDFQQWFSYYNELEIQGLIENEFEVRDMYTNEFIP